MSIIIHKTDFKDVEEIASSTDNFYIEVIRYYKNLFVSNDGFDLYFFEEKKFDDETFNAKPYYDIKISNIEKSFQTIHDSFKPKKQLSEIRKRKSQITEMFNKNEVNEAEIQLAKELLSELEIKKIIEKELNKTALFLKEAIQKLPSIREKTILSKYKVKDGKTTKLFEGRDVIRRIYSGTNLYLSTSQEETRLVYYGRMPFRLCGRGFVGVWKKVNNKWKLISSSMVWIS
jgi:hypothetical protein